VTVTYGAPWTIARHAWTSFATTTPAPSANLNARLLHLGGTGRVAQWHVAVRELDMHPWLGGGAGTYEQFWDRYRTTPSKVRDVHNLYLEVLAELGPVGLALLVAMLALPLAAAWRARHRALAGVAAGAYVAYLLHAVVDWDWEIASVTLVALACGAALLGGGRPLGTALRRAGIAFAVVLAAASVYAIATRYELGRESSAAGRGDWSAARADARHDAALQPWSAEPWQRLGEAELAAGLYADARGDLQHALRHAPRSWQLWLDLARASDGRARVHAMAEVRRLNPRSPELAAYLATLQSLGRIEVPKP
jgi:tetratricopeptide (TPR) repeat protein